MTLNAGIILGGQTPDILGAMDKGRAMAESQINLNRQNALADFTERRGRRSRRGSGRAERTGAVRSERFAGVQQNRLGIQAQQQDIEFSAEKCRCCATKASARPLPP